MLPKGAIILVSDQQLEDLQDPDKEVDLSMSSTPNLTTLRKICEGARAQGASTIILAFDEFWSQYRKGPGGQAARVAAGYRGLYPAPGEDQPDAQELRAGAGAEPAEPAGDRPRLPAEDRRVGPLGAVPRRLPRPGYRRFTVSLWEQRRWTNNKGTIELKRTGVRLFAFREHRVSGTNFYRVNPADIVELKAAPEIEVDESAQPSTHARRLTVRGQGDTQVGPLDRVLVVVSYATPEMDYFSPQALPVPPGVGRAVSRRRRAAQRALRRRDAYPTGLGLRQPS